MIISFQPNGILAVRLDLAPHHAGCLSHVFHLPFWALMVVSSGDVGADGVVLDEPCSLMDLMYLASTELAA